MAKGKKVMLRSSMALKGTATWVQAVRQTGRLLKTQEARTCRTLTRAPASAQSNKHGKPRPIARAHLLRCLTGLENLPVLGSAPQQKLR